MGFLDGKRAFVTGIASNRSIAWGIAQALHSHGADLALGYVDERIRERVAGLGGELGCDFLVPCDVSDDGGIAAAMKLIKERWDGIDILIHAVAFADQSELRGDFTANTSRAGFALAHDISAYSLIALVREARPLMAGRDSAVATLSYLGADRAIPNYNVMGPAKASLEASVRYLANSVGPDGIRVNALSSGPIRTLAAAGIGGFKDILGHVAANSPLRRNVEAAEIGQATAFLCSPLASAITGQVIYADCGFSITAIPTLSPTPSS